MPGPKSVVMPRLSIEPPWTFDPTQVQNITSFLTYFPENVQDLTSDALLDYAILAFDAMVGRWSIEPQPWDDRSREAKRKLERSSLQDRIKRLVGELETRRHGDQSTKPLSHRERDMADLRRSPRPARGVWIKSLLKEVEKLKIQLEDLERTM